MPALALAALLLTADVTPTVKYSSADDCEIMVLAGKEKLGWGAEKPKYAFSGNAYTADGAPIYVANCAWKDFGIIAPEQVSGGPNSPIRGATAISNITHPVYDSTGIFGAANVTIMEIGSGGVSVHSWACKFFRYSGHWNLSDCAAQPDLHN